MTESPPGPRSLESDRLNLDELEYIAGGTGGRRRQDTDDAYPETHDPENPDR